MNLEYYIKKYKFTDKNTFYYGKHMFISKGLDKAITNVNNDGGNCLQIFVTKPLSGRITDKLIEHYKKNGNAIKLELNKHSTKLFIHSPYVFNFAKPIIEDDWLKCYWVANYIKELGIAHDIGAIGCVIHVGKSLKMNIADATVNMYNSLSFVTEQIKKNAYNSVVILETGAGQGTEMFLTENNTINGFANFYNLFSKDQKKYIKLCVDTCHIFSAGYSINSEKICYQFFAEFEKKIGLENLVLIHLNDSKKDCCSKVDRHENLGEGKIGIDGIRTFIKLAHVLNIPLVLETSKPDIKQIIDIKNS